MHNKSLEVCLVLVPPVYVRTPFLAPAQRIAVRSLGYPAVLYPPQVLEILAQEQFQRGSDKYCQESGAATRRRSLRGQHMVRCHSTADPSRLRSAYSRPSNSLHPSEVPAPFYRREPLREILLLAQLPAANCLRSH